MMLRRSHCSGVICLQAFRFPPKSKPESVTSEPFSQQQRTTKSMPSSGAEIFEFLSQTISNSSVSLQLFRMERGGNPSIPKKKSGPSPGNAKHSGRNPTLIWAIGEKNLFRFDSRILLRCWRTRQLLTFPEEEAESTIKHITLIKSQHFQLTTCTFVFVQNYFERNPGGPKTFPPIVQLAKALQCPSASCHKLDIFGVLKPWYCGKSRWNLALVTSYHSIFSFHGCKSQKKTISNQPNHNQPPPTPPWSMKSCVFSWRG